MASAWALTAVLGLLALGAACGEQVQLVAQPMASTEATSDMLKCGEIDGSTGAFKFYPNLPSPIQLSNCTFDVKYSGAGATPKPTSAATPKPTSAATPKPTSAATPQPTSAAGPMKTPSPSTAAGTTAQFSSTNKRGVGTWTPQNDLYPLKACPWWYTWGINPGYQALQTGASLGMEFVSMVWSTQSWGVGPSNSGVGNLGDIPSGTKVLLGFNEPNHGDQAALQPWDAAKAWLQIEQAAAAKGLRLGSPAPNPCGGNCVGPTDPFQWWDQFFGACKSMYGRWCNADFIHTHMYTCDPSALAKYINEIHQRYGKNVWITEFACPQPWGGLSGQITFMRQAMSVMDNNPVVERYAWFAPSTSGSLFSWIGDSASLLWGNQLSSVGALYVGQANAAVNLINAHTAGMPLNMTGMSKSEAAAVQAALTAPIPEIKTDGLWSTDCAPCVGKTGIATPEFKSTAEQAAFESFCTNSCGFQKADGARQAWSARLNQAGPTAAAPAGAMQSGPAPAAG